MKFTNCRD